MRRSLIVLMFVLAFPTQAVADTPAQLGPAALQRYFNGTSATHWVTTGPTTAGYVYEGNLGFLEPGGGPGRIAIYSCLYGAEDHFLSTDAACEGTTSLGRIGYTYAAAPTGVDSVPVYRCFVTGRQDHFATNDPGCEGQLKESAARLRAAALGRAAAVLHAVIGDALRRVGPRRRRGPITSSGSASCCARAGAVVIRSTAACPAARTTSCLWTRAVRDSGCSGRGLRLRRAPDDRAHAGRLSLPMAGSRSLRLRRFGLRGHSTPRPTWATCGPTGTRCTSTRNPASGVSWATPGAVTAGFFYQQTLGFLLPTGGPNLQALYGCRTSGGDYFLSLDAGCEGVSVLGRYGFVYSRPAARRGHGRRLPLPAQRPAPLRSLDAACGGATTEARLGYLRTTAQGAAPPSRRAARRPRG